MAGESPDKSEQQQSSGTTRNERDPRLGVFREPEPESGTGSGSAGTGEDPAPGDAPEAAESDASPAEGPGEGVDTAPEGAESALRAAEDAETPPGAPEAASDAPEAAETAEDAEADAEPEAAEAEEGDARLRAAVAAWVSTADDGEKDTGEDTDEADAPEEPRVTAARDEKPDAEPEAEPDEKPEASAKPEPEPEPAADPEPEPEPAAEPKAPVADAKEPADDEPATGRSESATAEPDETEAPADDDAPDEEPPAAEAKKPADDDSAPDEKAPAADADAPVDQPTAVFKAPRLPKVDQPTTALKITRSPSGQPLAAETESLTERTSRFVPLRADDVRQAPAPRKPESPVAGPPAALSGAERTRQQPMPPKPPLDLLAELTNTPPPPETPVRNAVRRVKIWTPLVLLLLLVFAIAQMVRPLPDPELTMTAEETYTFGGGKLKLDWPSQGQSAVTVDGVGSLGSSGTQKPAPIASVAKIMTAYVILQGHPLKGKDEGEKITVDQQAEDESKAEDESTAPISKGQQFTEKQMLQLLMIPSGNNAARLFARWDSSSEAAFVTKMNDEAKKLGMTHTTYTDPSGLKKTTVSTADDQLKLARAVMANEVFREIVDTPQIKIDGIDTTIYNNNTLLLKPGVSGIKTGSSTPAGGNLIWSANTVVDGKKLWIYGAVMGQQAGTGQPYDSLVKSLDNSLKLIEGAQAAVTSAKVVHKGDVVGYVDDGFGGRTPLVATADLKAKGWPGLKVELSVQGNGKKISRSMKAGTEVGVVTVGTGTGRVSAPVALKQDLSDPTFGQKLTRIG
ncbi:MULTISPECIES: serine hydrolase [unclassified Streptomyces]|uniref:serine hydrolase n=1 Tax=unclassified Streptomyces TaxID=2593676 RepID=UPI000375C083|nr:MULTISPECIES: serine hydrolase [unclassified Streptomyces]MYQ77600.1 D-alanyl-D-alanine carboxypeptidase [Streptomyces sp. SID4923]